MFDLIFSAMQAYNQIGLLLASLICLGIGGLLLGNSLYWRIYALRVTGEVIGVLPEGNIYFPVYRYTGPDGRTHQAKSTSGSSSVRGLRTGLSLPLLVSPHDPGKAEPRNDHIFDFIGLAFVAPGLWIAYTAVTAFPVTRMTFIVGVGLTIYAGERLYRIYNSIRTTLSLDDWRQHHGTLDLSKMQSVETVRVNETSLKKQPWQSGTNRKVALPILAIFALALAVGGYYQAQTVYALQTSGLRTRGEVVRLTTETGNDHSTSYYPIVRFTTAGNEVREFKDKIGGNPPPRRPGDRVNVLYLADKPGQAMIDRGWLINSAFPAIILMAAIFIAWLAFKLIRAQPAPDLSGAGPQLQA